MVVGESRGGAKRSSGGGERKRFIIAVERESGRGVFPVEVMVVVIRGEKRAKKRR